MTQALYRKWRPRKWEQVVAQDHVVQTLRNAIKSNRVGHAYLFSGPRGTGKTTTARLLAKAVNCLSDDLGNRPCDECKNCQAVNEGRFLDLIEIDAASNTSVEDVRDLRDKINFAPTDGKYKVYIIDEVHMLSTAAFNALLKTLEEPPPHAIFILATTEVHKIPATVLSRCQRHEFRRIPVMEIVKTLQTLCKEEKIQADEDALILIARQSTGALRDAISLLDQLASTGKNIDLELAQTVLGTATNQLVLELVDAIEKNNSAAGLETIHRALDSGSDPRQYARQVVEYLRNLLLMRLGNEKEVEATKENKDLMRQHSKTVEVPTLMEWIGYFNDAINDLRTSWQPSLALEIAFSKTLQTDAAELPVENEYVLKAAPVREAEPYTAIPQKAAPEPPAERELAPVSAKREVSDTPVPKPAAHTPMHQEGADLATQDLLNVWNRIKSEVKQRRPQTEGLLNSQNFIQVKNGILILGFKSEVLKSKMENDENIDVTRHAIKTILNIDLPIECIVVSDKGKNVQVDADVDPDGLVSTALHLGGKLVHKD
jgi:DNA polymerase-3 subunit gamma/tau